MSTEGGKLLVETLRNIKNIKPTPQNHEEYTYAPMISKEMAHIDWSKPTDIISKHICGMNSWPMAFSLYNGEVMKIITARKGGVCDGENGQIVGYEKGKGLRVKTCDGSIYIITAQFAGSKRMGIDEYLRGHEIKYGTVLE